MFLFSDIPVTRRFVQPYCAGIMPHASESSIAELVLQLGIPINYHIGILTLQLSHEQRHGILGRNHHQYVDMVEHHILF